MARAFDDGGPQYINIASAVLTGVPISMACWFNTDDLTITEEAICIADTAADNNYFSLRLSGTAGGDPISAVTSADAGAAQADTTAGFLANAWYHGCAVFSAIDNRDVYIDGGNSGNEGTGRTPAGLDNTAIGALVRTGVAVPMSGRIAEVGIWNIALTAAEIAVLAAGYSPLLVRPQNLVFYAPLIRELLDVVGGVALVNNGSTVGDHCPIRNPAPQSFGEQGPPAPTAIAAKRLLVGAGR